MERIKKIVLVCLIFVSLSSFAFASNKGDLTTSNNFDWNPVMDAIIYVESGGDAKAMKGNSVGVMQITPVLVSECNRILKRRKSSKRFKLSDRLSISKSKEMFLIFQSAYNPMNSIEKAIRSWNAGPHYSVKQTQQYFKKVLSAIKG